MNENLLHIAEQLRAIAVPVESLKFDENNARKHDKDNLSAIKYSLSKFGQQKPIVVDRENRVIAGNGTLQAAVDLGWKMIAASRTELEGEDAVAFALADNRSSELATWDKEILAKTLGSLPKAQAVGIGWAEGTLDRMLSGGSALSEQSTVPTSIQVVVECNSETQQRELYDRMKKEGYKCRLITL